jgi:hypothetical protein
MLADSFPVINHHLSFSLGHMYTTSLHLISFLSCISLVLEISQFLCTRHRDTHLSPPDSKDTGHDITMPCYEFWMQNVSLFSAAQNTHLKPFSQIYFSDLSHAEYSITEHKIAINLLRNHNIKSRMLNY